VCCPAARGMYSNTLLCTIIHPHSHVKLSCPQPPQAKNKTELFFAQTPKLTKFPDWTIVQKLGKNCLPSETLSFTACHYDRKKLLIVPILFITFVTCFSTSNKIDILFNIKIYDIM
jgi:hypothetical protein